jgi:hypothetical protein
MPSMVQPTVIDVPSTLTVQVSLANIDVVDLTICYFIKKHNRFTYEQIKSFTKEFGEIMHQVKLILKDDKNSTFQLKVDLTDKLTIKVIE